MATDTTTTTTNPFAALEVQTMCDYGRGVRTDDVEPCWSTSCPSCAEAQRECEVEHLQGELERAAKSYTNASGLGPKHTASVKLRASAIDYVSRLLGLAPEAVALLKSEVR